MHYKVVEYYRYSKISKYPKSKLFWAQAFRIRNTKLYQQRIGTQDFCLTTSAVAPLNWIKYYYFLDNMERMVIITFQYS